MNRFRTAFDRAARQLFDGWPMSEEDDPKVDDPVELLLTTAFDCAVKQNLPSCTVSWKCRPQEMRCQREACPCPVCGGILVHYRDNHDSQDEVDF